MDSRFNQVVIKKSDSIGLSNHNIWLAVHPLKLDYIRSSSHMGDHGRIGDWSDTPQYLKDLIDAMWEQIPGLSLISFSNGKVVIQHTGIFEDALIEEVAISILRPVLEANLSLQNL